MKKVFGVICLFLSLSLYAESEHKLDNVPKDFMGTYIPVQLELLVKEYMSYEKALNIIANSHYDILQLREDICYSQVRFSDGYAVKRKDFETYIAQYGYELTSNLKKCRYLVTNTPNSGSSKNRDAQKYGVEIITEEDFLNLLS